MTLLIELLAERDNLKRRLQLIDNLLINLSNDAAIITAVRKLNDDLKLDLVPDMDKVNEQVNNMTAHKDPFEDLRVGDKFEYINKHAWGKDYLTIGKVYYNREPGNKLVITDDEGKTRKYTRKSVANWFKYRGHASGDIHVTK